jgi:F-type H+-transporting ATPase subunit gamma
MANLQPLRRRIASVKNTQKITKAMKMVAASKLRRAQLRLLAFRPYALRIRQVVRDLSARVNREAHPLLQKRPVRHIRVTVVTSDRGLCGAFNANIFRKALQVIRECEATGAQVSVGVVGKKGGDYFRRRQWPVNDLFINIFRLLTFEHAMEIATTAAEAYKNKEFDEVRIVYNEFKSVIQQRVVVDKVLPIEPLEESGDTVYGAAYLYEPTEEEILAALLPKWAQVGVFHILLESSAAEEAARMAAMDGATRNAGDMIRRLTLLFNRSRQEAITKELMDIVGGAEALK